MGRRARRPIRTISGVAVRVLRIWLKESGLLQVVLHKNRQMFWSLDEFRILIIYEVEDYDYDEMECGVSV